MRLFFPVFILAFATFLCGCKPQTPPSPVKTEKVATVEGMLRTIYEDGRLPSYDVWISPNWERLAIRNHISTGPAAKRDRLAVDGQIGPGYERIYNVSWSADSSSCGYTGSAHPTYDVVIDHKVIATFNDIDKMALGATGQSWLISTRANFDNWLILNGQSMPIPSSALMMRYAPSLNDFAILLNSGNKSHRKWILSNGAETGWVVGQAVPALQHPLTGTPQPQVQLVSVPVKNQTLKRLIINGIDTGTWETLIEGPTPATPPYCFALPNGDIRAYGVRNGDIYKITVTMPSAMPVAP